jgi:hypothetical protein
MKEVRCEGSIPREKPPASNKALFIKMAWRIQQTRMADRRPPLHTELTVTPDGDKGGRRECRDMGYLTHSSRQLRELSRRDAAPGGLTHQR